VILAALAGALAILIGVPQATATTRGPNGLIAYAQELRPGKFQLFTIRPDGSGKKQITRVQSSNPDWSPDGRRLVFDVEHAHGPAFCSVELANADGSGVRDLTGKRNGCEYQPAFMPNGRRIVFVHHDVKTKVESIWSMNLRGGDRRPITPRRRGAGVTDPNVSPDGKWITYVRLKRTYKLQALFAVRPNGSRLHRLTPYSWEVAVKHDWSPDGKLIVLTTNADFVRPHESANLVTIRPDGSGMTQLTHFTGAKENAFAGSFSPDGTQIVFRLEDHGQYGLYRIRPDGGALHAILPLSSAKARFIDWGPRLTP
jgi:Tol biopolymer transport system component